MRSILLCIVMVVAGCATNGTAKAPTFLDLVNDASGLNNTVVSTTDTLVKSKTLTAVQATAVLAITDKVQAALTVANQAYVANNQATAVAKLSAAMAAVAGAQACLTQPATFTQCLIGVSAP
jgi:hypothetical protein